MKIIVIGSEGFLGRHLMEQGRAMGHDMAGCDIVGTPAFRKESSDLTIGELAKFERVIHSAGVLGTSETIAEPRIAVNWNITNTLDMLRKCHSLRLPFTYLTLGNNWLNPYSITKNCAAEFVRMYNVVHGLPTQVAVAYNVFGPYQKWKPVRKIVPEFMTKLIDKKHVELFFGGDTRVDMVYAPDVARAIIQNEASGTAHYGSGNPRSVAQVAEDCAKALGAGMEFVKLGARPGETDAAAIAPYPLYNLTPYEDALKTTAEWYRDNYRP